MAEIDSITNFFTQYKTALITLVIIFAFIAFIKLIQSMSKKLSETNTAINILKR
jgi:hypothetical protein